MTVSTDQLLEAADVALASVVDYTDPGPVGWQKICAITGSSIPYDGSSAMRTGAGQLIGMILVALVKGAAVNGQVTL